jgi:hypothetical protein
VKPRHRRRIRLSSNLLQHQLLLHPRNPPFLKQSKRPVAQRPRIDRSIIRVGNERSTVGIPSGREKINVEIEKEGTRRKHAAHYAEGRLLVAITSPLIKSQREALM